MSAAATTQNSTLFGHPTGLFTLFFAEMWERFSYYGMRALLVFYMIKGFLAYDDGNAYAVYGAYTALVYATPFIGGMLADRLLGARKAVVLGGLLMAAGHLAMTIQNETTFFLALALLICGNGFFKPNISTIVGGLYPEGSTRRDGGFTIFYMGINLGAAMSPLLCGYIGETYGWHYGFGLATLGMLVGLAVFVAPKRVTQVVILAGALASAISLIVLTDNLYLLAINTFVAIALFVAGVVAFIALGRGGLPETAGAPPHPERLKEPAFPQLRAEAKTYYLALIAIALLLQFIISPESHWGWIVVAVGVAALVIPWLSTTHAVYVCVAAAVPVVAVLVQRSEVAGMLLTVFGVIALGSLVREALRSNKSERERMYVVLILMFFSLLFWAFFEQAGSSVNNFTDRNVDRVMETRIIDESEIGTKLSITLTQEQLGYTNGHTMVLMNQLDDAHMAKAPTVQWTVSADDVGMGVAEEGGVIPATVFQSANPIFILIFGLVFSGLWGFLAARGWEPSAPLKFAAGLAQLGLGFAALWYGAATADARGMVWLGWLLLGYLLHTTGELCLSPVGLSMVTNLSPKRIVSTVMGAWFLATAFSNYLASMIAALTGVGGEGEEQIIPAPNETIDIYGDVFLKIAIAAGLSSLILFVLSPFLTRWMHMDKPFGEAAAHLDGEPPEGSDKGVSAQT